LDFNPFCPKDLNHYFHLLYIIMYDALLVIMIIIALIGFSLIIYFYLEKTKKKRLNRIRNKRSLSQEDEVFNKVKRTKGVTRMMKRKGKEIGETDEIVDKAERALENGNVNQAKDLAKEASRNLAAEDTDTPVSQENDGVKKAYTVDELDEAEFQESEEGDRKRRELERQKEKLESLPDNYLESKFELKLVRELLEKEEKEPEAERYYKRAEESFDNEEYTDSLKYSIKCKKLIQGKEGAGLISGQKIDKKEGPPEEVKKRFPDLVGEHETSSKNDSEDRKTDRETFSDASKKSEEPAVSKICPECSFEGGEEDSYCPKCGVELTIGSRCPDCGEEVEEEDEFCRKCGASLGDPELACPECGDDVKAEDEFCPNCGVEFE